MAYFKPLTRKLGVVALVTASTFAIFCLFARHHARAALPATAKSIHLYRSPSYGITGDYFDLLKAEITEEEFQVFLERLRLSPLTTTSDRFEGRFNLYRPSAPSWWNPSDMMDGVYHDARARSSRVVLAKYEAGNVYYMESYGY